MQQVGENETEVTEFILIGWSGRPKSRMALMVFLIIAYAVTAVGNGIIVLVVISDPRLQNPMYFFLCNLSILDLCLITNAVPQSVANCLVDRPVMSFPLCFTQIYAGLWFGSTECFLLAVMAYDRYVAISNPLRYMLIMNMRACILLATVTWTAAFMLTVVPCLAKPARFCGNNEVDQVSCEFNSVFKLICTDTSMDQISIYFTSTFTLVFPLSFILFSYLRILVAILKMHSDGGRMKAFSTCGSHLAVVSMYYGTSIFSYLLPQSKSTGKFLMSRLGELNDTEVTEFVLIGFSGKPKTRMVLMVFMTIIYLVTVIGNGVIVLVVLTETQLHNPMYFFLCNLSVLDICLSTTLIPQSIINSLVDRPVMSFSLCYTQMYASVYYGTSECFLLAVMAYDRYIAISNPLRYMVIMNWNVCIILAVFSWTVAFLIAIVPGIINPLRFCGHNELDHLLCEVTSLMKLVCSDTSVNQLVIYLTSSLSLVFPFCFILFSYLRIIVAILRVHSSNGRRKAFSTCGSHLAVVCLYYGGGIFLYLKPQPKVRQDRDKILSAFYAVVAPMLNPLIYTLRNQDVIGAVKRLTGKKV